MICSLHSNWEHLLFLVFNFQMDKIRARKLLVIIEMVLFIDWYHLYYSRYHPSIIVIPPNEIEINPYSTDILYYTAGFILQRLFVAKTEKDRSGIGSLRLLNLIQCYYMMRSMKAFQLRSFNIVSSIICFVLTNAFSVLFKLLKQIMF